MDSAVQSKVAVAPRRKQKAWVLPALGLTLLVAIIVASAFGAANVRVPDIIGMVINRTGWFHVPVTWRPADETIFFQLRLPRVLGAALVGAALSSAGVIFQGLLRNPLADPYVIGTSAGAALGATIAMMLPLSLSVSGFGLISFFAFAGALGTVATVYSLARSGGRTPVINLLLSGVILSTLLIAAMSFFMSMSERFGLNLHTVYSFLMGGVTVTGWDQLKVSAPIIGAGLAMTRMYSRELNALALGEEGASYLGISVERDKALLLATGSLLTAAAVAISGLVGFVGLIIPHAVRLALGPDHRQLTATATTTGAIFLVLCDLLARSLFAPVEIPVGFITAMVGAPFFIYLLRRTGKKYTF